MILLQTSILDFISEHCIAVPLLVIWAVISATALYAWAAGYGEEKK